MEKKKRKQKLVIQISIITSLTLVISVVFIAFSDMYFSKSIYLTSDREMIDEVLTNFCKSMAEIPDLKAFIEYVEENGETLSTPTPDEEEKEYETGKYDAALDDFYSDPNFRLANQSPEEREYLVRNFISLVKYRFYVQLESDEDAMGFLIVKDEHTSLLLVENDKKKGVSTRIGVPIEYEASEHSAVRNILDGELNEPGKIVYEEFTNPDSGKYYYSGYTNVFVDGEPLFTVLYQDDLSLYKEELQKRVLFSYLTRFAVLVILNVILMIGLYIKAVSPLKKVEESVKKYRDNKDTASVVDAMGRIKARNEVGVLADSISDMATEIEDYIRTVRIGTAEKERIGTELALARKIQLSALPSKFPAFPDRSEFDVYASMNPAKEVGGDFYDFFLIDEDHLALVIGDVSDKGVPAALFMMMAKNLIRYSSSDCSPAGILTTVNERIMGSNENSMFITVWLGILDIRTGTLTCCNAGHECPAVSSGGSGHGFTLLDDEHGLLIGLFDDTDYTDYELQLKKGDTLFIYTDGVPEAANMQSEQFGTTRMLEALNTTPDAPPQDILRTIRTSIDEFAGDAPQFDDLTMLCLKYFGD